MRKHLFICLQQSSFTSFLRASAEACKTINFTYNLDVHCTCQDVYFEEDIERTKVISWHNVVPAMISSTGSVC